MPKREQVYARRMFWLSWSACGVSLALIASSIALATLNGFSIPPQAAGYFLFIAISGVVGALIASRQPENPVGWILVTGALLFSLVDFADQYAIYGIVTQPDSLPIFRLLLAIRIIVEPVAPLLLLVLLPLYFPTGRLLSARWRYVVWFVFAMLLIFSIVWPMMMTQADPAIGSAEGVGNPLRVDLPESLTTFFEVASAIVFMLMFAAAATSVVLRFHRASGIERQQMKWFAYAFSLMLIMLVIEALLDPMIGGHDLPLTGIALPGIPLAIGVAILRHRLYDIDFIINRTLVYGSLTATLLLVYLGVVTGLSTLIGSVASPAAGGEPSSLALAVSTLVVFALFRPLRARIQRTIDRRFYRQRYDAAGIVATFNARLRDQLDLNSLQTELHATVRDAMQPEHVVLWFRHEPER